MTATVPVEPLRVWIEARLRQLGPAANGRSPFGLLADELGIDKRRLFAWREENGRVPVRMLEDVLDRAGVRLTDLYPELEPDIAGERFCPRCHDTVTVADDLRCPWCEAETEKPPRIAAKRWCPSCDRMVWPTNAGTCWRCEVPVEPVPWDQCGCGCGTLVHRFDVHGRRVRWVVGHAPRSRERDSQTPLAPFAQWLRAELRDLDPIEALARRTGLSRSDVLYVLNERGETFSRERIRRALWIASRQGGGGGSQPDARVPGFFDLYPALDRRVCPGCGGPKARHAEICKGCRIARDRVARRPRRGQPVRLSEGLVAEAYELYVGPPERGYMEVAEMIFDRSTAVSVMSLSNTLRYTFRRNGWRTRGRTRPRRFGGRVVA